MQVNNNAGPSSLYATGPDLRCLDEIDDYLDSIIPIVDDAVAKNTMDLHTRTTMSNKLADYYDMLIELEKKVTGKDLKDVQDVGGDVEHYGFIVTVQLNEDPIQRINGYLNTYQPAIDKALKEDRMDSTKRTDMIKKLHQFQGEVKALKEKGPNDALSLLENRIGGFLFNLEQELNDHFAS